MDVTKLIIKNNDTEENSYNIKDSNAAREKIKIVFDENEETELNNDAFNVNLRKYLHDKYNLISCKKVSNENDLDSLFNEEDNYLIIYENKDEQDKNGLYFKGKGSQTFEKIYALRYFDKEKESEAETITNLSNMYFSDLKSLREALNNYNNEYYYSENNYLKLENDVVNLYNGVDNNKQIINDDKAKTIVKFI